MCKEVFLIVFYRVLSPVKRLCMMGLIRKRRSLLSCVTSGGQDDGGITTRLDCDMGPELTSIHVCLIRRCGSSNCRPLFTSIHTSG